MQASIEEILGKGCFLACVHRVGKTNDAHFFMSCKVDALTRARCPPNSTPTHSISNECRMDSDENKGETMLVPASSLSPTDVYFLVAVEAGSLKEGWHDHLAKLKITIKWDKLKLACRNAQGTQVVRSCSVDVTGFAMVLMNELLATKALARLPKYSKRHTPKSGAFHIAATSMRDDLARLVVGGLITYEGNKDWREETCEWKEIEDGHPLFADWDAWSVFCLTSSLLSRKSVDTESIINKGHPQLAPSEGPHLRKSFHPLLSVVAGDDSMGDMVAEAQKLELGSVKKNRHSRASIRCLLLSCCALQHANPG